MHVLIIKFKCNHIKLYLCDFIMLYRNIAIALWLITQGLGTLFNAGIAFLPITLLVSFFFYVGLMIILTLVFILMNRNYKYREDTQTEDVSGHQK